MYDGRDRGVKLLQVPPVYRYSPCVVYWRELLTGTREYQVPGVPVCEGVDGNSQVQKVTCKNCVSSKIDLVSRYRYPKQKKKNATLAKDRRNVIYPDFSFFCELHVYCGLSRSFRSNSQSVILPGKRFLAIYWKKCKNSPWMFNAF